MESVKQLRAFFKYEGNDQRYLQKAKLATGMIGAYARLRASETNRMAVELQSGRFLLPPVPQDAKPTRRPALKD
jgi:hypothetical protein